MKNNLGKLNAIFIQNISNLFGKKNGAKIIKEFTSIIKDNKLLLEEYLIFENIENYKNNENSKEYINECLKFINESNKKELGLLNEKVANFMDKNGIKQISEINNEKLFENIHNLIFTKKSLKTINERIDQINEISNYIKENSSKEEPINEINNYNIDDNFYKFTINKFNDKYSKNLTEEEKNIFKIITDADNSQEKITLFEKHKKECLTLANNFLKETNDLVTKEKLLNVKEKLLEQTYDENSYIQDILSLVELKKTLL